ncbi:MAG: hypothetical protein LC798_20195 [Chloroflexi bacterium]|nr:hypothetical protein [Chloroflexota bacterium]
MSVDQLVLCGLSRDRLLLLLDAARRHGATADVVLDMGLLSRRLMALSAGIEDVTDMEWTGLAHLLRIEAK